MTSDKYESIECESVVRLMANPGEFRAEAGAKLYDLLGHVNRCPECQARMDEMSDESADMLLQTLAGLDEKTGSSIEVDSRLNEIMRADAKRTQDIREAVKNSLIPGLLSWSAAGKIARNFDPLLLYSTTESVSMTIERNLGLNDTWPVSNIELRADGSVWINLQQAITADQMALEISRFANLWDLAKIQGIQNDSWPIQQGRQLAEWTFLAAHEQPNLLRDFRAASFPVSLPVLGLTYANFIIRRMRDYLPTRLMKPQAPLWLVPLDESDRIDDVNERWLPVLAADPAFVYGVPSNADARRMKQVYQFSMTEFSNICGSYQTSGMSSGTVGTYAKGIRVPGEPAEGIQVQGEYAEMTFFVTDKGISAGHQAATTKRKLLINSGYSVDCVMVGNFSDVRFEANSKVKLTDDEGQLTTRHAQRLTPLP